MKVDRYKLLAIVAISFGLLTIYVGTDSIIQTSFKSLDDFEQTSGELERTALIDSMSMDKHFKYVESDYLGLKLKSDSSKYAVYHLNLDLKKIEDSLKIGETLTIYYQSDQNPINVKQVEQNGVVIADFKDNRNYLTWFYLRIIFISMLFLLFGRWILKIKTGHNTK